MIIQIRGTSGSGKSTVMRKVMAEIVKDSAQPWDPETIETRKMPLYYNRNGVIVLGHYEIACGGCDTIGSVPQIFAVIKTLPEFDYLLCEGLLLSEDVKWTLTVPDTRVIFLTTDPEECLTRVKQRQQEKGREPTDPARVRRKLLTRVATIERARLRLVSAGVYCRRASADQAPGILLNWIRN